MGIVKFNKVSKSYKKKLALKDISCELFGGEIVGLIGPNGAGKSTFFSLINAISYPTFGNIEIFGKLQEKNNYNTVINKIGVLSEHNPLYPKMYTMEILEFACKMYGIKDKNKAISRVIELFGIQSEVHKKVYQLSKGFKQRLGLAISMIHDPKILLLDEPTSGFDPSQQEDFLKYIPTISSKKLTLISSHNLEEIKRVCTRYLFLKNGTLIIDRTKKEFDIFSKYRYFIKTNIPKQTSERMLYDTRLNLSDIFFHTYKETQKYIREHNLEVIIYPNDIVKLYQNESGNR